jgi:hypothetical protein
MCGFKLFSTFSQCVFLKALHVHQTFYRFLGNLLLIAVLSNFLLLANAAYYHVLTCVKESRERREETERKTGETPFISGSKEPKTRLKTEENISTCRTLPAVLTPFVHFTIETLTQLRGCKLF